MKRERPILFSGPMIRAILAGRKSQTRRGIKPQPDAPSDARWVLRDGLWHPCVDTLCRGVLDPIGPGIRCPYGAPGDRLWVREAWQAIHVSIDPETGYGDDVRAADKIPSDSQHGYWSVVYAATDPQANEHRDDRGFVWRPGIHMPRWASRITLEITGVRVERLNAISEADARAEGVYAVTHGAVGQMEPSPPRTHRQAFELLWCEINGAESWERNDWVWVIEFRRVEPGHGDADLAAHHAATSGKKRR